MDHHIGSGFGHGSSDSLTVRAIQDHRGRAGEAQALDFGRGSGGAYNRMAGIDQHRHQSAANGAGGPGEEDLHFSAPWSFYLGRGRRGSCDRAG